MASKIFAYGKKEQRGECDFTGSMATQGPAGGWHWQERIGEWVLQKSVNAGEDRKATTDSGRVTIVVYPGGLENRAFEARNK
jgi:hypothetical protein